MRHRFLAIASLLAIVSAGAPARAAGEPLVFSGPGSYLTTYTVPVAAAQVGGSLTYVNADAALHDVVTLISVDSGGRCTTGCGPEPANPILNSSFEGWAQAGSKIDMFRWKADAGTVLVPTEAAPAPGSAAASGPVAYGHTSVRLTRATGSGEGDVAASSATRFPVTAGVAYTVAASFRPGAAARTAFVSLVWQNAAGAPIGETAGEAAQEQGAWIRPSLTAHAPAGASQAVARVGVRAATATEVHYADGVQVDEGEAATAFAPRQPWCDERNDAYGRCPVFWSELIGLGRTTPVLGLENVVAGNTYTFFCTIHRNMTGTLVALPG